MNSNSWVRVTDTLAQSWEAWLIWRRGEQLDPEPALDEYGKDILNHVIDPEFAFKAFKPATIDTVLWRMGNFHGVTVAQMRQGAIVYPGEWVVLGAWTWKGGDKQCMQDASFPLDKDDALLFMPDVCADADCTSMAPATELADVSLAAGQPPRDLS